MTRMQSSSGLAIDLAAPDLSQIHIEIDIAGPLSRLARFGGHHAEVAGETLPQPYTVAQHCVVGADAVLEETGNIIAALAFLVHDAHEALIGGLTAPAAAAIEHWAETAMHTAGGREVTGAVRAGIDGLKQAVDRQIHRLAGLPHPLPSPVARAVKDMDRRMLDLERRLILGPRLRNATVADVWGPVAEARPVRIRGALVSWNQRRARSEWMRRWETWRDTDEIAPFVPRRPISTTTAA